MNYVDHFSTRQAVTPQTKPIPGTAQVPNSAGGFSWQVDDWTRLDRFLILGAEGGTYYIQEKPLTIQNAEAVKRCIAMDGPRVVARVVEISDQGRAPKNDPALFVLAMCAGMGDDKTRKAALAALPKVARIGTHLFHFAKYVEGFRGWGRGLRTAVQRWYGDKSVGALAFQAIKYQQRDGWSHRDMLRLAKPKTDDPLRKAVYKWIAKGVLDEDVVTDEQAGLHLAHLIAFTQAHKATTEGEIVNLVKTTSIPWEAIPTQWLTSAKVWQALLPDIGLTALIRNLGRMTANEALKTGNADVKFVVEQLTNKERIKSARVHPIAILAALLTYKQGHGERGSLKWAPIAKIVDALDAAFYLSFGNVTPTNKRLVLALDVSGSMDSGTIAGVPNLTPRVGAAAMALITQAVESDVTMLAFSSANGLLGARGVIPLTISPRQRLDDVIREMSALPFCGTDCSLPITWAQEMDVKADAFIIYTDSETYAGHIHPAQALKQYRQFTKIPAKSIVVGMTSNGFTIADPNDAGMMDVVGFDTATPNVISQFIAG